MLDASAASTLSVINLSVNRSIKPASDKGDVWSAYAQSGDYEDYALAKRQALIAADWAPSHLPIAVVEDPLAGLHAMLIARTDSGDLILDSLTDQILPWAETGLTFISHQSAKLPAMWVKL